MPEVLTNKAFHRTLPVLQAMKPLTLASFTDDDSARLLAWLEAADKRRARRELVQFIWRLVVYPIMTMTYPFLMYAGASGWLYWRY